MNTANEHERFGQLIEAHLAGGLVDDERDWFLAHAAGCALCVAALAEAQATEAGLAGLFAAARPPADFEDRLVQRLRWAGQGPRRLLHPAIRRAVSGVAAALLLGSIGYVANAMTQRDAAARAPVAVASADGAAVQFETDHSGPMREPSSGENGKFTAFRDSLSAQNAKSLNQAWFEDGRRASGLAAGGKVSQESHDKSGQNVLFSDGHVNWGANGTLGLNGANTFGSYSGGTTVNGGTLNQLESREKMRESDEDRSGKLARNVQTVAGDFVASGPIGGSGSLTVGTGSTAGTLGDAANERYRNGPVATNLPAARAFKPTDIGGPIGKDETDSRGLVVSSGTLKTSGEETSREPNHPAQAGRAGPVGDNDSFLLPTDGGDSPRAAKAPGDTSGGEHNSAVAAADGTPAAPAQLPPPPAGAGTREPPPPPATDVSAGHKIIRNGQIEFEVDSFDTAAATIGKIVGEEGGYVATTNSDKLPNGKMKGTIIVRVEPGRLDRLIMKLRALGELKSQRIAAQDITKQYTDIESALRAAKTMETRLLEIIKNGKGEVKDLVEAEKQLGIWREKIDQLEGEIRYYNNLVSLSTLSITVFEKSITTPAAAFETEQVNMGIETDDVKVKYGDVRKAIDDAKGRIIESDLKQLDAGQWAGRIVAEVAPDAAGPLEDRLKQLGTDAASRVARYDTERRQTTQGGSGAPAGVKVQQKETRLLISIYNLANIAPRQTTSLNLACEDVEKAYNDILALARAEQPDKKPVGRVVASTLNAARADQVTGSLNLEITAAQYAAIEGQIRAKGETMSLTVTENPDTANVTAAKRGIVINLYMLATVAPRETRNLSIAAKNVGESYNAVLVAVRQVMEKSKSARILASQLNEQDRNNVVGTLSFEVPRSDEAAINAALAAAGQATARQVGRSAGLANTIDSKVRLDLTFFDENRLEPRESTAMKLAVGDVPEANRKIIAAVTAAGGLVRGPQLIERDRSNAIARLVADLPRAEMPGFEKLLAELGDSFNRSTGRLGDGANIVDTKVRYTIEIGGANQLDPRTMVALRLESGNPEQVANQIAGLAGEGTVIKKDTDSRNGQSEANVIIDVPMASAGSVDQKIQAMGKVLGHKESPNAQVPDGKLTRARFEVTVIKSESPILSSIGSGLSTSAHWLLRSLTLVVVGLCVVVPVGAVLWGAWKVNKKLRKTPAAAQA